MGRFWMSGSDNRAVVFLGVSLDWASSYVGDIPAAGVGMCPTLMGRFLDVVRVVRPYVFYWTGHVAVLVRLLLVARVCAQP